MSGSNSERDEDEEVYVDPSLEAAADRFGPLVAAGLVTFEEASRALERVAQHGHWDEIDKVVAKLDEAIANSADVVERAAVAIAEREQVVDALATERATGAAQEHDRSLSAGIVNAVAKLGRLLRHERDQVQEAGMER